MKPLPLLLSLALSATTLMAEDNTTQQTPAAPQDSNLQLPIQITSVLGVQHSGKSFTISPYRNIVVRLPDNSGSTGFTWKLNNGSPNVMKLISSGESIASNAMPGSSQMKIWNFQPIASGQAVLTFSKERSWETNSPTPPESISFTINVEGASTPTPSAPGQTPQASQPPQADQSPSTTSAQNS